jgi:hypothetical protein
MWSSHEHLDMGPILQWRLDYFSMVALISQWDHGSLVYFVTMIHTYPWNPGSLVYFSIKVHTYTWDPSIWFIKYQIPEYKSTTINI